MAPGGSRAGGCSDGQEDPASRDDLEMAFCALWGNAVWGESRDEEDFQVPSVRSWVKSDGVRARSLCKERLSRRGGGE